MSKNHVLSVIIVLALTAAAAIAFIPGFPTRAEQIDSATRSYIGWAKAVEEHKLVPNADRSYDQVETERGGRIRPAGFDSSDTLYLDSATRSYIAWAKAVEEQQQLALKVDRSYDQVEHARGLRLDANMQAAGSTGQGHRGGFNPSFVQGGRSMAASGTKAPIADRSYDVIENLRLDRASE